MEPTRESARSAGRPVGLLVTGDTDGRYFRERLERRYDIVTVPDVAAAAVALGNMAVDFVLVNAALADPDMMELITHVRVDQWLRGTPVICYARRLAGRPVSRMAGLAAHDFIIEPVTTEHLVARIELHLTAGLREASP